MVKLALVGKFNFTEIDKRKVLDYLESNQSKFKHVILSLRQFEDSRKNNDKEIIDFEHIEKCKLEDEYYTFYFNHPLDNARCEGFEIGSIIYSSMGGTIEGMISKIQKRQTRNGNTFYIVTVVDKLDSVQIALWGNQIGKYRHLIHEYSFIKMDIIPSKYSTWNMTKHGSMERIRTYQEMSEQEERDVRSEQEYSDLIKSLKEHSKNESIK